LGLVADRERELEREGCSSPVYWVPVEWERLNNFVENGWDYF